MNFYKRDYTVFLMLTGPDAESLWHEPVWTAFAADLAPYANGPRGSTAVRTTQFDVDGKAISFGRLGWNDQSHAKWTHADDAAGRRFCHVEAWTPSWRQCERDDRAPDFYFGLANEALLGVPGKTLQFNQRLVCALAADQGNESLASLQHMLRRWAGRLRAPLLACQQRPWGSQSGGGFVGAIQDLISTGIFKPGDRHLRTPDADSLKEIWTLVTPQN